MPFRFFATQPKLDTDSGGSLFIFVVSHFGHKIIQNMLINNGRIIKINQKSIKAM